LLTRLSLSLVRPTAANLSGLRATTLASISMLCLARKSSLTKPNRLDGEVVIFLVGTHEPRRFTVHENIVKAISEFVRLALRGDWAEASSRIIPLPEDEPAVFSVYQHWLYNGLIHTSRQGTNTSAESDEEYELLLEAYILGEKILDIAFKNSVMGALVEKVGQVEGKFNKRLTSLVFDNTPSASPLRRLWLVVYYHVGNVDWLRPSSSGGDTMSRWFLIEFGRFQMANRDLDRCSARLTMPVGCTYHEH
jgi:hypothetical protein